MTIRWKPSLSADRSLMRFTSLMKWKQLSICGAEATWSHQIPLKYLWSDSISPPNFSFWSVAPVLHCKWCRQEVICMSLILRFHNNDHIDTQFKVILLDITMENME